MHDPLIESTSLSAPSLAMIRRLVSFDTRCEALFRRILETLSRPRA
jgi:hypothetical protein